MQDVVARAISQGISDGIQQLASKLPFATAIVSTSPRESGSSNKTHAPRSQEPQVREASLAPTGISEVSDGEEAELDAPDLSEDENSALEAPVSSGFFNPSLFRAILTKARVMAPQMGLPAPAEKVPPAQGTKETIGLQDPGAGLFKEASPPLDLVPAPQLFLDIIQHQWAQPDFMANPSGTDKKLYSMEGPLEELLKFPQYFGRAALFWLRKLLTDLLAGNTRARQDIRKIIVAVEYSANASLAATKFSSRALASNVTSRRLLWLRHWQVDVKTKWKLISAPFKGGKLFGETLDPFLMESKDKCKILPPVTKKLNPPLKGSAVAASAPPESQQEKLDHADSRASGREEVPPMVDVTSRDTSSGSPTGWSLPPTPVSPVGERIWANSWSKANGLRQESRCSINLLELRAARLALRHFHRSIRRRHNLLMTDNVATKAHINCQGGTRSKQLMAETEALGRWAECHLESIHSDHISGIDNTRVDWLSRTTINPAEWQLDSALFRCLTCSKIPRVRCFLKGALNLRPPTIHRYPTRQLSVVLQVLTAPPFEPLHSVSLRHLTLKTAFLIAITSARRISELVALLVRQDLCIVHPDRVVLRLDPSFIPKINTRFHRAQEVILPRFCPRLSHAREHSWHTLDVRWALKVYLHRTSDFRQSETLFISFQPGSLGKKVTSTTVGRWLRACIASTYEGQSWVVPHEGTPPLKPAFTGLFYPSLYKLHLFKAKAAAKVGNRAAEAPPQHQGFSAETIFDEQAIETDTLPTPKAFFESVKRQWAAPTAGPMPTSTDKTFFNVDKDMAGVLSQPSTDAPVLKVLSVDVGMGPAVGAAHWRLTNSRKALRVGTVILGKLEEIMMEVHFEGDLLITSHPNIQTLICRMNNNDSKELSIDSKDVLDYDASGESHHSMYFPKSFLESVQTTPAKETRLICIYLKASCLFQDKQNSSLLSGDILGASLGNMSVTNLREPVEIRFWHNHSLVNFSKTCVFWVEGTGEDNLGEWRTEGCETDTSQEDVVLCKCSHLTYFAVLL
ncbi:PREDICTED: uncharacterized protein LOC106545317, partial [Thamnophis sirtalis]|uniref:Uncharacterized protein LOC106545317 n=1 Tax=Thamnophis sirtalis TaxID=35019 RepID=A0A6I9Y8Q0_9SAUR